MNYSESMEPRPINTSAKKSIEATQRTLALKLYEFRSRMDLTQQVLADLAGIDRKTINRIENGHFSPTLDTLLRLSIVLRVSIDEMIGGD